MRQIVLDTETTGINKIGIRHQKHRIIEIGAVEIINRRLTGNNFHVYLKPNRAVDPEAFAVHGITDEFLIDKPTFSDIADEFIGYISGAELVIHNAAFDIEFIDYEFGNLNRSIPKVDTFCKVIDSLKLARKIFPGKRNSLDALCSRYGIDHTERTLHSALLDAKILADVYLNMTAGQTTIIFDMDNNFARRNTYFSNHIMPVNSYLRIVMATDEELASHKLYLSLLQKKSGRSLWLK